MDSSSVFSSPSFLNLKTFKCTKCSRVFSRKHHLQRHAELHKDIRMMFSCNICSSTFTHQAFALNDPSILFKTYKCSKCSRVFSQKHHLQRHEELHKDIRIMFPCNMCTCIFTRKDNLQQHEKIIHNIVNPKRKQAFLRTGLSAIVQVPRVLPGVLQEGQPRAPPAISARGGPSDVLLQPVPQDILAQGQHEGPRSEALSGL
ncbi:hypothetical protein CDAR_407621 [Caerostris darwini]|uniref:C2H2-type domain-containing protein n=1 Tax=Caerostris darwini TaxID=1538125 RepID=A0AAV4Q1I0_9ARAC|nr:hypothetical protein CDAR_407621 [Caerostris darwini]